MTRRHTAAVDSPTRDEWIFDARTFEFLGERSVATGRVTGNTAILERAVVDRAGQRP
ncbi:hypothetical protein AB0D37_06650 [Streptomyces sp. NPDC048384]|uniref:hypothetical protein n=1 Tax=Streptomyces sp. NPDC048384 TaxID=3155487 RepID=UPI00341CEA55